MNRHYSSKTAVWILCALFVLISAVVAVAKPVDSAQAQAPVQQQAAGGVTDTWAVQISPGTDPDQLALQMGAQNLGQIGALTGYYLFRIPGTDSELTAMADVFAASSQVVWFEQQVARQQTKRVIEDPVYLDQWHLVNANVEPAWIAGFTGVGVNIAIVDDGLQHSHPDLIAQYKAALSHDYNGDAPLFAEDGDPEDVLGHQDYHGTASAGIAAADYNGNALATSCGVGVAYDAGLSGLRLIAAPSTPDQVARALNFGMNPASLGADFNSIYNNSWGPADDMTEPLVGPGTLELAALQAGVTSGRNGKGSIYVWAAGNGLASKDNVNYDGYANSRFTIAVGAVGNDDTQASYSEPGAAMLVTAPGGISGPNGIVTTDLLGHFGYSFNTDCTEGNFDGTSASAPLVSGVVALMLDANPNLGWRDVQNILARTAVKNDPTDADWDAKPTVPGVQTNGDGVNGLHVNHKYGFGLVDAAAAVTMAADPLYKRLSNDVNFSSGVIVPDINNRNIPDNILEGGVYDSVASVFDVTDDIKLEHVEVVFYSSENLNQVFPGTGGYRGDLRLVLTSPSGTESVLSEPHGDSAPDYTGWKFMTVRNWGESSLGTWTLRVTDEKGGGVSVFDSWELILHGTGPTADVDVNIAGNLKESYAILKSHRVTPIYSGVHDGPVQVVSTNAVPIITSERAYRGGATITDFNEMMGFPADQLTTEYWFPWYDGTSFMQTYLVIGNASTDSVNKPDATVDVYIHGNKRATYTVPYGGREVHTDWGLADGPVRVVSTNGVPIITSERAYRGANLTDFNEMMGFPANQLTTEYWFPWYDGTSFMQTYLVIGNASTDSVNKPSATVDVYIGGNKRGTTYTVPYGGREVHFDLGLADGPVRVVSTNAVPIITSERAYRGANLTDFNEMMGYPADQLTTEYWFPWYDGTSFMQTYLVIGNASTDAVNKPDAIVDVYIGGSNRGTYTVPYGGRDVHVDWGLANGPVRVVSTNAVPIITSERAYRGGATLTDFNEMMGFPAYQLTTEYWFPWYDFTSFMQTYLVVGNAQ